MAAKIINEKSTVSTVSGVITTVYTVPSNKAARVRLMFAFENDGSHTSINLFAGTDGSQAIAKIALAAHIDLWTGIQRQGGTTDGSWYPGNIGVHLVTLGGSFSQQNNEQHYLLVPLPVDYYLAAGDVVKFGTTNSTSNVQGTLFYVVGVEDDA